MRLHWSCAAIVAAILMVSQAAIAGEIFPKVLVLPVPLKPYTDEILRGLGASQSLLRTGQEPHDFSLSPSQAKALDSADILIIPDLSINPMLARMVAKKKHLRVIELSKLDGADALPYEEENPFLAALKKSETDRNKTQNNTKSAQNDMKSAQKDANDSHPRENHDNESKALDPHLWLDPERMAAMAAPLAEAISTSMPESKATLKVNATALAKHLREELLPPLRAMLSKKPRTTNGVEQAQLPFITYHAAYQYFLGRFGLAHTGEITQRPEEMMGAKTMGTLITTAEKIRVRCIIGEEETTLMSRMAKLTGAKTILLSPEQLVNRNDVDALDWLHNDYDRLLYQTVKAFAQCL